MSRFFSITKKSTYAAELEKPGIGSATFPMWLLSIWVESPRKSRKVLAFQRPGSR